MKSNIPHTAIQHTRCWLAVTAVKATLKQFSVDGDTDMDILIQDIFSTLSRCEEDVRRKKVSAGAVRSMKAACAQMERHMLLVGLEGDALYRKWGAAMWVALTLVEDCRNTCPAWFVGPHWHALLRRLTLLCTGIAAFDAAIPEEGTAIYELVAEAA